MMGNLRALTIWLSSNTVTLDGESVLTGALSGPAGVDPTLADHYSRKAYVDDRDTGKGARVGVRASGSLSHPGGTVTALLSFSAEAYDTHGFITPTSTDFTIPTGMGGIYLIEMEYASVGMGLSGTFFMNLQVNGSVATGVSFARNQPGVSASILRLRSIESLVAGGVLRFNAKNTGAAYTGNYVVTLTRLSL
jgi:hypothetical protein